ncbi:MAG: malate/lactate/ureidoglycolate dehydrogenase [Burkholderiales bacterium]|nr:malate/lactate/ureidoglycolate dehydrogenase [Burkholderiales bacterium]
MHILQAAPLTAAIRAIVKGTGSSDREADLVATNLVEANLKGHDSHGIGMIPRYVDSWKEGGLAVNAHVSITLDANALLRLDGNQGYGQVIGYEAMELGAERARRHGVCVVGLANAHHIGRIGAWAEQCIGHGLVSVHFVNVLSRPIVAPWGGRDARHGTNPFCVGVPRAGGDPVVLDFATSRIAQGKTRVAYNKGEQLAPGTIIDTRGDPTTDPRFTVVEPYGAILPFGEHKGSGLALICELLGGALAGGTTQSGNTARGRQVINGMFSILIDPTRLGTAENLARELEAYVAWHIASPPAAGVERVLIAGEPERATRRQRLADGIPVDDATWNEILGAADKVGMRRADLEAIARA